MPSNEAKSCLIYNLLLINDHIQLSIYRSLIQHKETNNPGGLLDQYLGIGEPLRV